MNNDCKPFTPYNLFFAKDNLTFVRHVHSKFKGYLDEDPTENK